MNEQVLGNGRQNGLQCALGCSVTELNEPCSLLSANFKNWPQGMYNVLGAWGKQRRSVC